MSSKPCYSDTTSSTGSVSTSKTQRARSTPSSSSRGEELEAGTDPRDIDTDDDLLLDGEEGPLGCDPLNPDTDGGSASDGSEVAAGTDPLDPEDDTLTGVDLDPSGGSFHRPNGFEDEGLTIGRGCGCNSGTGAPGGLALFGILGLLGLRRRYAT